MRLFLALALVCFLGIAALYQQTDGFTVLTSESARRISVARHPEKIPDAPLNLASGQVNPLLDELRSDGRVAIVNFIYTRCITICLAMGSEFQQLQHAIQKKGLSDRIRLLSISFDPADTPAQLGHYARAMHANPAIWQFVGVAGDREREALLKSFGIVVVPAPLGQFVHNAAYHVVTADGRLVRIIDFAEPGAVLAFATAATLRAGAAGQLAFRRRP